jgi:type IV secretory pathway TrbD component
MAMDIIRLFLLGTFALIITAMVISEWAIAALLIIIWLVLFCMARD